MCASQRCTKDASQRWLDEELPNSCKQPNLGLHPIQLHLIHSTEASRSFRLRVPVIPVPPSREVRLLYSCVMLRDSRSAPKTRWTSVGPLARRPVALFPPHFSGCVRLRAAEPLVGLQAAEPWWAGSALSTSSMERELVAVGCASVNIRCEYVV